MGEAAQARARALFDWPVVIGQYRDLLGELGQRRAAGQEASGVTMSPPARMDPFANFAAHASVAIYPEMQLRCRPGGFTRMADLPGDTTLGLLAPGALPGGPVIDEMIVRLSAGPMSVAALAAAFPAVAWPQLHRVVGMLLKYGFLSRA
jgi:hypothetical protein